MNVVTANTRLSAIRILYIQSSYIYNEPISQLLLQHFSKVCLTL